MGTFLSFEEDLKPLAPKMTVEEANIIVADVEAFAVAEAPCIIEYGFPYSEVVRGILRQAALRWHRAGEGAVTTTTGSAGPFSKSTTFDTRARGEGRLYPQEIQRLRRLCRDWQSGQRRGRKAFTVLPGGGFVSSVR